MNFILDFFLNIILSARCESGNKTYNINQTVITRDCKKRCVCTFVNGAAELNCSALCTTPEDPGCRPKTQQVEEYKQLLSGTNCSCAAKRCIPGLKLFRNNYLLMFPYRAFVLESILRLN